jgi:hypothetical protein
MAPQARLRLPEPGSFEDLLRPVRIEIALLVRLSRHPTSEPYWSTGVYRFDDPDPGRVGAYGTCYSASSIEVAFAESVIHESGRFVAGTYEVPTAELTERSVVRFACEQRKTLVLADFHGPEQRHQCLRRLLGEPGLGAGHSRCKPALGRNPIRVAADELGLCLRHLRAHRASQAEGGEAQGTAGG